MGLACLGQGELKCDQIWQTKSICTCTSPRYHNRVLILQLLKNGEAHTQTENQREPDKPCIFLKNHGIQNRVQSQTWQWTKPWFHYFWDQAAIVSQQPKGKKKLSSVQSYPWNFHTQIWIFVDLIIKIRVLYPLHHKLEYYTRNPYHKTFPLILPHQDLLRSKHHTNQLHKMNTLTHQNG